MIELAIIIGAMIIADAIMFTHGYKSWIFCAKTEQEKAVRRQWFAKRGIEWDEEK